MSQSDSFFPFVSLYFHSFFHSLSHFIYYHYLYSLCIVYSFRYISRWFILSLFAQRWAYIISQKHAYCAKRKRVSANSMRLNWERNEKRREWRKKNNSECETLCFNDLFVAFVNPWWCRHWKFYEILFFPSLWKSNLLDKLMFLIQLVQVRFLCFMQQKQLLSFINNLKFSPRFFFFLYCVAITSVACCLFIRFVFCRTMKCCV